MQEPIVCTRHLPSSRSPRHHWWFLAGCPRVLLSCGLCLCGLPHYLSPSPQHVYRQRGEERHFVREATLLLLLSFWDDLMNKVVISLGLGLNRVKIPNLKFPDFKVFIDMGILEIPNQVPLPWVVMMLLRSSSASSCASSLFSRAFLHFSMEGWPGRDTFHG